MLRPGICLKKESVMKKYSVQLANLALFFAMIAPGVAIGMENDLSDWVLVDKEQRLPSLPPDIRKVIANKTLRLILDEADDKPEILMGLQTDLSESFIKSIAWTLTPSFMIEHPKTPVIDTVIYLIVNGANPNTKNYKSRTVFHLLTLGFMEKLAKYDEGAVGVDYEYFAKDYLVNLKLKIKLLVGLKVNLNEKSLTGMTTAYTLILH
jgi:hypothetical protein